MDPAGSLEFTSKTNCCSQFDDGGFVLDFHSSFDGGFHGFNIMVSVFDMLSMPSVSFETFQHVFSESTWNYPKLIKDLQAVSPSIEIWLSS